MRQLVIAILLCAALVSPASAVDVEVDQVNAELQGVDPVIRLGFSEAVPASLDSKVLDPSNYTVEISDAQEGEVVPAVAGTAVPVTLVVFEQGAGGPDRTGVVLHLEGVTYGKGLLDIQTMTAGGDTLKGREVLEWEISGPYELKPSFEHEQSLRLQGGTPVVDFSLGLNRGWASQSDGKPRKLSLTLEGSGPIGTPDDVEDTPGADTEASEEVADYFKLSALRSSYSKEGTLQAYGLVARSTVEFKGLETVLTYQLARLLWNNRAFAGGELEAGYRRGDAEWESLTKAAPDRGDTVGRVGAVLEWGPQLGPINRDLGQGLRFFLRGRGWADYAKNEEGDGDVRFRGFFDSELFYNISDEFRVFLRYELGYLPPDLSQRHSEAFVGVGSAF